MGWFCWLYDQLAPLLTADAGVLEVGAGTGSLWVENAGRLPQLAGLCVTDFSAGMLKVAERRVTEAGVPAQFEVADVRALQYGEATFDIVIADHMLYHVPEPPTALREIARVLSSGGWLVAATNGGHHMRELDQLIVRFLGPEAVLPPLPFTHENGPDQLHRCFTTVELKRHPPPHGLAVTDTEPVLEYIRSLPSGADLDAAAAQQTRRYLAQQIDANGCFRINTDAGVFLAQRPYPRVERWDPGSERSDLGAVGAARPPGRGSRAGSWSRRHLAGGELASGEGDEFSDIDLHVAVSNATLQGPERWREVARFAGAVFARPMPMPGGLFVNAVTLAGARFDLVVHSTSDLGQGVAGPLAVLKDREGLLAAAPERDARTEPNAEQVVAWTEEFLRCLLLLSVVTPRQEWISAEIGSLAMLGLLKDLMLAESSDAGIGSALRPNRRLTDEQETMLRELPPLAANQSAVVGFQAALVREFLPRARRLCRRLGANYPEEFEAVVRMKLGDQIILPTAETKWAVVDPPTHPR